MLQTFPRAVLVPKSEYIYLTCVTFIVVYPDNILYNVQKYSILMALKIFITIVFKT